jgi:NTP pyrophosphatase (non-canonical NTP hydrolase)
MRDIQRDVSEFITKNKLGCSPEYRTLDLTSEIGEIAKEVLKVTDYGRNHTGYRRELEAEIGDAFFSLIALANSFDIDLSSTLQKTIEKYERRISEKGTAGSTGE